MSIRTRIAACDRRLAAVANVLTHSLSIPYRRKAARVMDKIDAIRKGLVSRQQYTGVRRFFCEGGLQQAFGAPRPPQLGVAREATTPTGAGGSP